MPIPAPSQILDNITRDKHLNRRRIEKVLETALNKVRSMDSNTIYITVELRPSDKSLSIELLQKAGYEVVTFEATTWRNEYLAHLVLSIPTRTR